MNQLLNELKVLIDLIKSFLKYDSNFKRVKFTQMKDSIEKLNNYLSEPVSFMPDVNLWLLADEKPIGVCTIKSNDIIWSSYDKKRGSVCNKSIYTDIKSLNPIDREHPVRQNLLRIRLNVWLGLYDEKDRIFENLNKNDGHGLSELHLNQFNLPTRIFYTGNHTLLMI